MMIGSIRNVMLVLGVIVAMPCLGQYTDTDIAQFQGCVRLYPQVDQRDACFRQNSLLKGKSPEEFMAGVMAYLSATPDERRRNEAEQALQRAAEQQRRVAEEERQRRQRAAEQQRLAAEQERQRIDACMKGLPSEEAALVGEQKIRLGMSETGLVCSWGKPKSINRSVGSWGEHKQYIYDSTYVYVENGKVTSWQD